MDMAEISDEIMSFPPPNSGFHHDYSPQHHFTSKVHSRRYHQTPQTPPLSHPVARSKPCSKPRVAHTSTGGVAVGGPGMQAVFLNSRQKSCGTGVFLPRIAGNELKPSNKRAFSPVLLPSRVVQALNINVHELGLQIKPRVVTDGKNNKQTKEGLDHGEVNRKKKEVTASQSYSSPDIFLPKEWTY